MNNAYRKLIHLYLRCYNILCDIFFLNITKDKVLKGTNGNERSFLLLVITIYIHTPRNMNNLKIYMFKTEILYNEVRFSALGSITSGFGASDLTCNEKNNKA